MFAAIADSIALVHLASPLLALISLIVFEVPRYLLSTIALALYGLRHDARPISNMSVSVILPAFNNGTSLHATIASLQQQSAHITEIMLVNEGSSDHTLAIARALKRSGVPITIIQHGTRTGKSAAINHAARFASGDVILVLDADTIVADSHAVARLAEAFSDPSVAAACGNLIVRNGDESLSTAVQTVEYLVSVTAGRSFLDMIDSIGCVSGAFSMYRRSVFRAIGGMNVGPGEDLEITMRLRHMGYRVRFVAEAMALTRVPSDLFALVHQRLRWDRDALCVRVFMYRQIFPWSSRERLGDSLQRLDFLIFDFFPTLFFPFYLTYVLASFGADALSFLLGVYIYLLGLCVVQILVVIMTARVRLSWFDVLVLPVLPFYQGFMMRCVRFYAFVSEIYFNCSRRDDFVPPRVRKALYGKVRHAAE